ncbi:hypothetical protein C5167_001254 [Papaver somniferum]|uniref:Uncharacterized protein n=1 Tax=Papaver somniferum TaxID=3469 RepID=A0A4Y7KYM5_PAPSO|nr:hypothetical protein C5167_001254 [Papaver somniferum]
MVISFSMRFSFWFRVQLGYPEICSAFKYDLSFRGLSCEVGFFGSIELDGSFFGCGQVLLVISFLLRVNTTERNGRFKMMDVDPACLIT